MKKIAIFHPSTELYGADRIMVIAAKALEDYIPVIYLPSEGKLIAFIKQELPQAEIVITDKMPIISRALMNPKGLYSTFQKRRLFKKLITAENKKHQFSYYYVNTLACALLLPILGKMKNTPTFTHVHEILEKPHFIAKLTAKLAFKHSKAVISVSKAVQDNLHRLCKNRAAKSLIIHNGIPEINCLSAEKKEKISFYLFGRIKPEKGQWYLLEALKQLPPALLDKVDINLVGGVLSGKEQLKEDLLNKIETYGLTKSVKLHGFTDNIEAAMTKADVCLIPSLMKDPFPTTVLEAMSAGKMVIATDTGGAKEAITHQQDGFIIPANQPARFAEVLENIIQNPDLIASIGLKAKETFENKFTIGHFSKKWLHTITSL